MSYAESSEPSAEDRFGPISFVFMLDINFPVLCLALVKDCMPILLRLQKNPPLWRLGSLSSEDHRMTLAAEDLGGGGSVVPLYVEEEEEAEV